MQYFGRRSGFLSTVAVVATMITGAASAQQLRNANPPAEFPPSSYSANQYVDSRGCVYVRAGIGGTVDWVPRVTRGREQLCGFQPTRMANATTPAPSVPNPQVTPVAREDARPAPAPAPVVTAAPAPAPIVRAPAPVVAAAAPTPRRNLPTANVGTITPLAGQSVAAPTAPSPRVITPAPVQQPRVLTRAQACAGLTGIQPNLIGQRSGQPIDCGTAPAQVATVTPPAPAPQASTSHPRMTRAQACADMVATGRRYVSASTGLAIQCALQTRPATGRTNVLAQLQADLSSPQRPYSNPLDAAPGSTYFPQRTPTSNRVTYSNPLDAAPGSTFSPGANTLLATGCRYGAAASSAGMPVACGPQVQSPSGGSNEVAVTRARRSPASQSVLGTLINPAPPPYSNPTTAYALPAPTVPSGYDRVWSDGRLNTQRGIPAGSYQVRDPSGHTSTARYDTQPIPQVTTTRAATPRTQQQPRTGEQISGHRYVQVGTFATRNEAQAIARSLQSRGLPMRVGVYDQQGREMRIVLAGPFANDSQLRNALGAARGAGFSGAFTRR